jgi:signal transduction histidine kinase
VSGNSAEGFQLILAGGVAAYSVAAYSDRKGAYLGLAAFTLGYAVYALEDRNIESGRTAELWAGAFFAVGLLAAWLGGTFVHSGRERVALQAVADDHQRAAAAAVAAERSRLARELHDIVSHNLSVVVLQAGGARAQGENAPSATLEKIERSSREALVEMRRLLGVLRESDADASLAPQPGIADIEALCATVRTAGLPIELTMDGRHDDLPPALQLSVYRIDVLDDGVGDTASSAADAGHGLVGIRERVALFGGTLELAPRPEGGFALHASLRLADAT